MPRITREDWRQRLQALACEAGENGDENLEIGFLLLARACALSARTRQALANVALFHLSIFERKDTRV